MERELFPHQIFGADFNQIIDEAQRQEDINSANSGELNMAKNFHDFIASDVGPYIESSQWVYEGSLRFAEEFAPQYFNRIRLTGEQTVKYQEQLLSTNDQVIQLLAELKIAGKAPRAGEVSLTKASDFPPLINYSLLSKAEKERTDNLLKRVKQHEGLQLTLTLDAISNLYEIGLPRLMFVIRRALKSKFGETPISSDDTLLQPSDYIDWIRGNLAPGHILESYFADDKPRKFYRMARNVANHHRGLDFDTDKNIIRLVDRSGVLDVPLYEFQQRYRFLTYFVYYGIRGILYYFANKERGSISVKVCNEYETTFPSETPNLAPRRVKAYE